MAIFPSFQSIITTTQKTSLRFPLETITAFVGTIISILLIDEKTDSIEKLYVKLIMCCSLCLVLFLSVSLYFSVTQKKTWIRYASSLVLGSIGIVLIFSFGEEISEVEILQFFVLNVALHLLVSFAGFIPKLYNQNEFWEFNKQLFIRILTAGLYSGFLFGGLALAITAVQNLFNVEFNNNIYGYLFFIIAGIFNTLFFLAGIPDLNYSKSLELNYPKGLKNFTQFVLMPLISIYLIILISYEAKILVLFTLPIGWVSYLVLVFSIFGILSFLLIYPIAKDDGNLWMKTFNRWFYFLLIPLLGLLFWAILYRVFLYGFSFDRYYVLALAVWLLIVVFYFLIQNEPKIKFIPISMCIIALLTIIGPQSADSISKYSQLSRFENYMQMTENLNFKQEQDLTSIVDFLEKNYGAEVMKPLANNKLNKLLKEDQSPDGNQIMEALGYEYRSKYESSEVSNGNFYYSFYSNDYQNIENIHGYDMSFSLSKNFKMDCKNCLKINGVSYSIQSIEKDYGIDLKINRDVLALKIIDFINKNKAFNKNYNEKIIQKIDFQKYTVLITYRSVSGKKENQVKKVERYEIDVLLSVKTKK